MVLPKPNVPRPARAVRRAARRPRLVAVGDLVLDIVVRPQRGLVGGSDVGGTIGFRAGGSAANTCRAFVQLGGAATLIGAVGDDTLGRRLAAALRRDGVTVRTTTVAAPTARLLALLDPRGERSFVTHRGAADKLRRSHLKRAWLARSSVLHLPAYSLLAEPLATAAGTAVGYARDAGAIVSVDLASRGPLLEGGRDAAYALLRAVAPDLLLGNADEAAALCGRRGLSDLLRLAPVLVVKEGAAGCRVLWRGRGTGDDVLELDVATTPLETADTTGAGDAFDAGFLHTLTELAGEGGAAADALRQPQVLRRAAVAGHRAAARWLTRPRAELVI